MKLNIKLPQTWNELSEKQLQHIAEGLEHYRKLPEDKQNHPKFIQRLYLHFIKNLLRENSWFKVRIALRQIPPSTYLDYLQFLLNENKRHQFPKAFKLKGKTYFPPAVRLQNVKMKEFSFADTLFYHWRETGNTNYLDLLCVTLYRQKGSDSEIDVRKPFEKILTQNELPKFSKLSYRKKLAIAYAYEGSRNYIIGLYPHVFPKPIEAAQDPEQPKTQPVKPTYTPFGKLLHHKVNFDPSKLRETEELTINEFLSIYENELVEIEKQKK